MEFLPPSLCWSDNPHGAAGVEIEDGRRRPLAVWAGAENRWEEASFRPDMEPARRRGREPVEDGRKGGVPALAGPARKEDRAEPPVLQAGESLRQVIVPDLVALGHADLAAESAHLRLAGHAAEGGIEKPIRLETRSSGLKLLAPLAMEKGKRPWRASKPRDAAMKIESPTRSRASALSPFRTTQWRTVLTWILEFPMACP